MFQKQFIPLQNAIFFDDVNSSFRDQLLDIISCANSSDSFNLLKYLRLLQWILFICCIIINRDFFEALLHWSCNLLLSSLLRLCCHTFPNSWYKRKLLYEVRCWNFWVLYFLVQINILIEFHYRLTFLLNTFRMSLVLWCKDWGVLWWPKYIRNVIVLFIMAVFLNSWLALAWNASFFNLRH